MVVGSIDSMALESRARSIRSLLRKVSAVVFGGLVAILRSAVVGGRAAISGSIASTEPSAVVVPPALILPVGMAALLRDCGGVKVVS